VGEYENILFLEAARMMKLKHPKDVAFVMVSYLPVPSKVGEMKTKPTQHAVRTINASGIQPDIIIARSVDPLDEKRKEKLSLFCNVPAERVISAPDVDSIYDIPANFEKEHLSDLLCDILFMTCAASRTESAAAWDAFVASTHQTTSEAKIAVVGKYFDTGDYVLSDSYISVIEAIRHAAYAAGKKPVLTWIHSVQFEEHPEKLAELSNYDGIIVPGGFGTRGVEGIIATIKYAREHKIPYLGLCYGMQLAVVEYARSVAGLAGAHTKEVDSNAAHLVIDIMAGQKDNVSGGKMGGTMRLGAYPAVLAEGTLAAQIYGTTNINERHRHRYEVSPQYIAQLEQAGLVFSGKSPDGTLCEFAELPQSVHPFFIGTQAHPEFKSHPLAPHPLFVAFIQALKK
jgi:CTP synthase